MEPATLASLKQEPMDDDGVGAGSKKAKIARRNKQKHNETERKRREHLAQLFEDMKKELQEEQEAEGGEPVEMENRNAVLEQALIYMRRLKVKASSTSSNRPQKSERVDDIPGLRTMVDYIEYLKLQLSRKRKLTSSDSSRAERGQAAKMVKSVKEKPATAPVEFLHTSNMQEYAYGLDDVSPASAASTLGFYSDMEFPSSLSPFSEDSSSASDSANSSSSTTPEIYAYNSDTLSDFDYGGERMSALPQQSTTAVDFSRLLFSLFFFFGLFYTWSGDSVGIASNTEAHIGRVLQEHSPSMGTTTPGLLSAIYSMKELLLLWLLWNPIIGVLLLFFCYIVILVISEPVMMPSSYFYQQADKEYKQALSATSIELSERHYLNALAYLGRAFPSGFQLKLSIAFQFIRYLLHCMYVGVWLDKLLLFTRGGEASHKQAADLYLSLMRNCHGRIKGLEFIYLSLCTINISQLFDPIWVAETYAHISFFLEYRFPQLKALAAFYLQLAWRIAKSENNSRLVWLLYATSHIHMRKGNWKDAETYLKHISDKLAKLQQTLGGRALPNSAQTLIRYALLTKANLELGRGEIGKGYTLVKELEQLCSADKKNELNSAKPNYIDPVCARLAMLIEVMCLFRMNKDNEAEDALMELRRLEDDSSEAPSCAMEEVAKEGLLSYLYYLSGDKKMAIAEADKALRLARNQDGQQLFVWLAYPSFIEVLLLVWEGIVKDPTTFTSATDYLLPSSGAWLVDEEGRPKVDLSGASGREIVIQHLEKQISEGVSILEKNAKYMDVLLPTSLRLKGSLLFLSGKKDKAMSQWESSVAKAKELRMVYEEAKAVFEIGKSMMQNKCRCLIKRRHNVSCAIHHLETANSLFIRCGTTGNSQQVIELIEAHQKASSSSISKSISSETLTSEDATMPANLVNTPTTAPSIYEVLCTQETVV
eukprot:TRINITY_DN108_c0_g1_i1.p1 TRINITY_DN108_c0_g1~~TRINITY_DN108_c0_g1_i1.p1  ORF type:complete len:936 (+),score=203.87 TRINITY_DN108_c0_g1_i1:197-3004(+)